MFEEKYLQENNCSTKSKSLTKLLCIAVGFLGIHYFYVGKIGSGLLRLFTWNFIYIGVFIDYFIIRDGLFRDKNGLKILY